MRDDRGGLAIQAAENAVVLRAQLDPGNVFHAHDSAIRSFADDNVFELLRRCQAALSKNGIGELLARRSWFAANLTGRIHRVLRLDRVDDLGDGDAQLRQLVRLYPEPHGILPRAEDLCLATPYKRATGSLRLM